MSKGNSMKRSKLTTAIEVALFACTATAIVFLPIRTMRAASLSPLVVDVEVDDEGSLSKNGDATVSGTVYCSNDAEVEVFGQVQQKVLGHLSIYGYFYAYGWCDAQTGMEWQTVADSEDFLKGGWANIYFTACGWDGIEYACSESHQEPIKLKNGGK